MTIISLSQAVLASVVLYVVWKLFIQPEFISPLRKIPKAKFSWYHELIGWLYTEPNPLELLRSYQDEHDNPGVLCYSGGADRQRIVVVDPDALKELTTTQYYGKYRKPDRLKDLLSWTSGHGLISADGQTHKALKKKILASFSVPRIKGLAPLFWAKGCELSKNIETRMSKAAGEQKRPPVTVDIAFDLSLATLDVIGVAAWGLDFDALKDPTSEFMQSFYGMFPRNHWDVFLLQLGFYFPMHTIGHLPFRRYREFTKFKVALKERCARAIAAKREVKDLESNPDVLSSIIGQDVFTDAEIIENLYTLLMAGHDATAATITWIIFELARHPKVQQRLREELHKSLPFSGDEEITFETLEQCSYLQAVMHEAERMHPTAPKAPREAAVDTTLCGYNIPKGTQVLIAPLVCNRVRSAWGEDAGEFNPNRWMEEGQSGSGGAKSNYSFMTFNSGPRHCIGQRFAEGEMMALVANIVGRFSFENAMGDPDIYFGMTMRPKGGLRLKMQCVDI